MPRRSAVPTRVTRRHFLAAAGAAPLAASLARAEEKRAHLPVGLEMYSVRDDEKRDLPGTLRAVAGMGYEGVEFWGPYFEWTAAQARDVRKQLDDLKLRCFSTHNRAPYYAPESFPHVLELNRILGSRYVVMAPPPNVEGVDGWKSVAETLSRTHEALKAAGMRGGFHNHAPEWKAMPDGVRPIDVLTANTPADFAFQLDVGTCLASGADPVAFIKANPGRVKSYHLKDWSPDPEKGYKVLFGEGAGPWKEIFAAAEKTGGAEYYLIEQEGSRLTPLETARQCLENYRKLRGS
jgi:sugar phosphate isomerase/epimerase